MLRRLTALPLACGGFFALALGPLTPATIDSSQQKASVSVRPVAQDARAAACSGVVAVERACAAPCPADEPRPLRFAQPVDIPIAAGEKVTVRIDAPGCWAAPIDIAATDGSVDIPVWPAARVTGRVKPPRGEAAPGSISLELRSRPNGTAATWPPIRCPIVDGAWSCAAPAAAVDVRAEVAGFVPHYFWGLTLTADRAADLGELALRRGASVSGRVVPHDGKTDGVRVELRPAGESTGDASLLARRMVRPNATGFFQFADIELGRYAIAASREGASTAHVDVAVSEAREYALEADVTLEPLARLDVLVSPPVSPSGGAWKVRLERPRRGSPAATVVKQTAAALDGGWSADRLEAGDYRLIVLDDAGSALYREKVAIHAGIPLVHVLITAVRVEGRVTAGGEPLAAKIKLAAGDGTTVRLESADDGTFFGIMPREGEWRRVEITPAATGAMVQHPPVVIRRRDGMDAASLELTLPGGRISGSVVDENGAPVRAGIRIAESGSGSRVANFLTDNEGKFDVIGIAAGSMTIRAESDDADSGAVPVTVTDGDAASVRLVVARRRQLRGVVVTASGEPLAGATVRALTHPAEPLQEVFTGPSGQFVLKLARGTAAVDLVVHTPGFPLKLVTLPLRDGVARIAIGRSASKLLVRFGSAPPWPFIRRDDSAFFPLSVLSFPRIPSRRTGGVGVEVEPGRYTICPRPAASQQCIVRTIAPGEGAIVDAGEASARPQRETAGGS